MSSKSSKNPVRYHPDTTRANDVQFAACGSKGTDTSLKVQFWATLDRGTYSEVHRNGPTSRERSESCQGSGEVREQCEPT